MAYTTASDLASGQIAMVSQARYTYEHQAVCTNLFTRMTLAKGEKSIYIPKFGTVTAKDLTDGVDMTEAQSLTITGTTHTTDEAGCKVVITKKLRSQLKEEAYRAAGKVIGNAMSKKIDQDGLGLFSGLSSGLSQAGVVFGIDYMQAAVTQLYAQSEPAPLPFVCVLHPNMLHEVVDALATPSTNTVSDTWYNKALQDYWRGNDKLFGVPLFSDGNISVDSGDDSYGAVFSKMCFIYLVGWEPDTWVEYDGSLRGWEIGIVSDYSMVEEDDTYGRYLLFETATVTS